MPVNNAALVVGGGIAGMTAALALAEQGFPVHLVEKAGELGGTARQLHDTLDGQDVQAFLAERSTGSTEHPRITVYLNTQRGQGRRPRRRLHLVAVARQTDRSSVKHGVVVVATGATEQKPQSYGYGQSPQVLTQLELSDRLGTGDLRLSGEGHGGDDPVRRAAERPSGRIAAASAAPRR